MNTEQKVITVAKVVNINSQKESAFQPMEEIKQYLNSGWVISGITTSTTHVGDGVSHFFLTYLLERELMRDVRY